MNNAIIDSIVSDVKSCDDVVMATCGMQYPDVRHLTNMLNHNIDELELFFITGADTPKYNQLRANPKCALYYFNPNTRHAVRLFGQIEFITDANNRQKYWKDEFHNFGYNGPTDPDFVLMHFVPNSYKIYVGNEMKTGLAKKY